MAATLTCGRRFALACTLLAMSGCGNGLPDWLIPNHNQAPAGGKTTMLTFNTPSMPFDDPAKNEPSGFAPGHWVIAGDKLQQTVGASDNLANQLRYVGDAFNSKDGRSGAVYSVSVDCSVSKDADSPAIQGYPTGVMALMPYYQDPTHYVLLAAAGQDLSCWVVNGYRPAGAEWPKNAEIWDEWLSRPLDASASIRWGADIDTDNHTIRILVNDQPKVTRSVSMITDSPHWVALGANGNYAQFTNFKIVWTK